MTDTLYQAATLIIPLVIAIVFHEVAHGWAANLLGDPTAKDLNRLSLNPIRHVDPVGTIVLPGMLALAGAPVFGWAKPVPVNKWRLREPRTGMMAVAAAGPVTNLLLALAGAIVLGLLIRPYVGEGGNAAGGTTSEIAGFVAENLKNFLLINIFLALFNLLPIPPFDGSHIVEGVLPRDLALRYEKLRPLGFPILFLLLIVVPWFLPQFQIVEWVLLPPVTWLSEHYLALTRWIALA